MRKSPRTVYKRPGKTGWWASLTTSDGGKRAQLRLGDKRDEALDRYGQAMALRRRGALTPEALDGFRASRRYKNEPTRLETLAHAWRDWEASKSTKRSWADDVKRWRVLTEYLPADTALKSLSIRMVDDAFNDLREARGVSNSTVNRYRALLRSVLNLQRGRRELGLDPGQLKNTREAPRQRVLQPAEQTTLLEYVDERAEAEDQRAAWFRELGVAIRLALWTACREGELGGLRWRDVDLRNASLYLHETKTGARRQVPLTSAAVELLREWKGDAASADRVFTMTPKALGKKLVRVAAALDIPDLRFHDLRATAATRMVQAGIDPKTVASVTGHSLQVLLGVYTRQVSEERRRDAVESLSG